MESLSLVLKGSRKKTDSCSPFPVLLRATDEVVHDEMEQIKKGEKNKKEKKIEREVQGRKYRMAVRKRGEGNWVIFHENTGTD